MGNWNGESVWERGNKYMIKLCVFWDENNEWTKEFRARYFFVDTIMALMKLWALIFGLKQAIFNEILK